MAATENPFEITKAMFLLDPQIQKLWVDFPDEGGFKELAKPSSLQPMQILGGKGSGKTHLLRYFSYRLQKIRHSSDLVQGLKSDGYIGNYTLLNGLNSKKFVGKGIDLERWMEVFKYYFDLFLSENLLLNLIDIRNQISNLNLNEELICKEINKVFNVPVKFKGYTVEDVLLFISSERKSIDFEVANASKTKTLNVSIKASPGDLIFQIPSIITLNCDELSDLTFLYIIDELENITLDQQVYINSLIRDCIPPVSIKVGSRLYGVKTERTYSDQEEIKEGSEFDRLILDYRLRASIKNYSSFSKSLLSRRLNKNNIEQIDLDSIFEDHNQYTAEDEKLVKIKKRNPVRDKKVYFKKLKKELILLGNRPEFANLKISDIDIILDNLSYPENVLIEKINCFLLYKSIKKKEDLKKASKKINMQFSDFINGDVTSKYKYDYDQWKSDMHAQLLREHNLKPSYSGLKNIIAMSDGLPRVLLMIMKKVYEKALFLGENPSKIFSIKAQDEGIIEASNWFYKDATPKGKEGEAIRLAIDNLATFFRDFRFSDKPSEKTLISFSYDSSKVSPETNEIIELASKWSLLIEEKRGHKDGNSNKILKKLRLNKMLCPRWMLPISLGGTIELNKEEVEVIFNPNVDGGSKHVFERRLNKLNFPFGMMTTTNIGLFDD